jgi:hypothetical protein
MTHESEERAPEPRESDETLREAQAGKGYGEDEGERDAAVGDQGGEDGGDTEGGG